MNGQRTVVADAELLRDMIVAIICQQKTTAMHETILSEIKTEKLIDFIYKEVTGTPMEGYDPRYIIMDFDSDDFAKLIRQVCMFLSYYVIKFRISIPDTKNDDPFESGEFDRIIHQIFYTLRYNMSLLLEELSSTLYDNMKGYRLKLDSRYLHPLSYSEIFTIFMLQSELAKARNLSNYLNTLEISILSETLGGRITKVINDVTAEFANTVQSSERLKARQYFYNLAHNDLDNK